MFRVVASYGDRGGGGGGGKKILCGGAAQHRPCNTSRTSDACPVLLQPEPIFAAEPMRVKAWNIKSPTETFDSRPSATIIGESRRRPPPPGTPLLPKIQYAARLPAFPSTPPSSGTPLLPKIQSASWLA